MTNEAKMKMKMKTKTSTKHNADDDDSNADDDDDSNDDDDDAETSNYPNQPDQEHDIPEQNRPEQDDKRKPPARRSSNGARGKAPTESTEPMPTPKYIPLSRTQTPFPGAETFRSFLRGPRLFLWVFCWSSPSILRSSK